MAHVAPQGIGPPPRRDCGLAPRKDAEGRVLDLDLHHPGIAHDRVEQELTLVEVEVPEGLLHPLRQDVDQAGVVGLEGGQPLLPLALEHDAARSGSRQQQAEDQRQNDGPAQGRSPAPQRLEPRSKRSSHRALRQPRHPFPAAHLGVT
ncbi:hypothetical protein D3C86_1660800 [compost metagenome]